MRRIRLFLICVVSINCIVIKAQAQEDKFYIEAGDAEVKVKTGSSFNWISPGIASSFNERDSLHVKKGKVWLKKNSEKKIDPIFASPAMSFNDAWILPHKNNPLRRSSPLGTIKQGNQSKDSLEIQFAFINHLGDSTIVVHKSDTLEAMVINHTSADTLYAYVYWELTPMVKNLVPMNDYIDNSVCVITPGYNVVFPLNQNMPIRWEANSKIIIIYSKDKGRIIPERKDGDYCMSFYNEASEKGFKINELNIEYQ
ncbi:MAG: hypothetical protein IKZ89_02470 [Bacteroidaceae bacterium]|nr:hypothetical protein [Bacteroidaceae bacterium]